ncbi:TetR family transcriptional regulator [Nonomuraea phyllanthi]|uniref:TetR family transcriptional regulator n=1 Tax=Nonomuraea phyllanthi TaxID=2219224 RepID=A0A5C4WXI2_9ACTN|nr:TetR/AcrR family transcriptional regulator [Nonomuraea phyllanthi]KAB8197516.1 TetR family transcriptional regulator [Nonomuraea phyllanthi]QFY06491.1 TetR family transcriptional regulator [Nonomuraea phyllanthi]
MPPRPRRADAQRNRDRLLAAAAQVFAERGTDAPLDDIARRAGVGNATLYRHFPTRTDLLVAVYADEVAHLCASGQALLAAEPPGEALHAWLRLFMDHITGKRDLAQGLTGDESGTELVARWHASMLATASALLDAARRSGAVRAGLDVRDLLTLVKGIALAATDRDQAERLLSLIR